MNKDNLKEQYVFNDSVDGTKILIETFDDDGSHLIDITDEITFNEVPDVYDERYERLTLNEIYEQVYKKYAENIEGCMYCPIIYVWYEQPLSGTLYCCNNYDQGIWTIRGELKGYA